MRKLLIWSALFPCMLFFTHIMNSLDLGGIIMKEGKR